MSDGIKELLLSIFRCENYFCNVEKNEEHLLLRDTYILNYLQMKLYDVWDLL